MPLDDEVMVKSVVDDDDDDAAQMAMMMFMMTTIGVKVHMTAAMTLVLITVDATKIAKIIPAMMLNVVVQRLRTSKVYSYADI